VGATPWRFKSSHPHSRVEPEQCLLSARTLGPQVVTGLFTLFGAAVGAVGIMVNEGLRRRAERVERERQEAAAERKQGATIVGPILALLRDANRIAENPGLMAQALVDELWRRWAPMRDDIEVYAAAHPDERTGDIADGLISNMNTALVSLNKVVVKPGDADLVREASASHAEARRMARTFLAVVRNQPPEPAALISS
jgi:hypothetical protein